jgi:hypothetical protein
MLRTFGVVTALQILALTPVWACTGQVGNVIFQDSFGDDTGGWDERPPWATVKPPNFVFAMDAQNSFTNVLNLTFNATDGDYCMDVILPPPIAANNQMYAGISFWATPDSNSSMMGVLPVSNGAVTLNKLTAGTWNTIFTIPNAPGFNSTANATNSLRVTALSGTITVYLNGTVVKTVRAQEPPSTNAFFGMTGQVDTAVANAPLIQVKGYSVTAGK